jgi:hypothetical protein
MPYLKIAYNTFYFYIYTCRLSVFRFFDQILLADRVLESFLLQNQYSLEESILAELNKGL